MAMSPVKFPVDFKNRNLCHLSIFGKGCVAVSNLRVNGPKEHVLRPCVCRPRWGEPFFMGRKGERLVGGGGYISRKGWTYTEEMRLVLQRGTP